MQRFNSKVLIAILIIAAFGSCQKDISSFQANSFIKFFGSGLGSKGYSVAELPEGGFIAVGSDISSVFSNDVMVVRVNRFGNLQWQKIIKNPDNEEGRRVAIIDNEVFVVGQTTNNNTNFTHPFLLRLSFNGDSLDFKKLGGTNPVTINDIYAVNNLMFLAGESKATVTSTSDYYYACINKQGDIIWSMTIAPTGKQTFNRIFQKQNGNLLLVGTNSNVFGSSNTHIIVTEVSTANGSIENSFTLPTQENLALADACFNGTNLYLLINTTNNWRVSCVSHDLELVWTSSSVANTGTCISLKGDNNLLITSENRFNTQYTLMDGNGNSIRNSDSFKEMPGKTNFIIPTSDGGLLMLGATSAEYTTMMQIIKTDSELFLLGL